MSKAETEESRKRWEENAAFWDAAMGDASNEFHRRAVSPKVTELLQPEKGDYILDIACGNGNYSVYLAAKGIRVTAFDYSEKMIALAKKRQAAYPDRIEFCVADATSRQSMMALRREHPYTKAVSNMAIMDIADIRPLFEAVHDLLVEHGIFVFSTQHPCFVTRTDKYMTAHSYEGEAILGQPQKQLYFHRSLQDLFNVCFDTGFVIDGFAETCWKNQEIPEVIIVRARKK
ncbi:MAG: class I SAM-dependent methyltransferase [Lactimicrobium sp.]|jgi:2-polyprenyl-3-methyl-5-hydroxy-6-metoxy-1,4-benzoquinol methylase|uniref:class I SAM-dependent DNA methyltransferase n=2 Tax=Lactimicrobium sp. TaxID=2563780 RepID=UPI002F356337